VDEEPSVSNNGKLPIDDQKNQRKQQRRVAAISRKQSLMQRDLNEDRKKREHDEVVASGKAIDPKEAMKRCFTSGSHGNEHLTGEIPDH
jgi:hypothetical protein